MEGLNYEQPNQKPEFSYNRILREAAIRLPDGSGYKLYNVVLEDGKDVSTFYGKTVTGETIVFQVCEHQIREKRTLEVIEVKCEDDILYEVTKH